MVGIFTEVPTEGPDGPFSLYFCFVKRPVSPRNYGGEQKLPRSWSQGSVGGCLGLLNQFWVVLELDKEGYGLLSGLYDIDRFCTLWVNLQSASAKPEETLEPNWLVHQFVLMAPLQIPWTTHPKHIQSVLSSNGYEGVPAGSRFLFFSGVYEGPPINRTLPYIYIYI